MPRGDPDPERDANPPHPTGDWTSDPPPKLIKFRHLTGIDSSRDFTQPARPARNLGIYARVVSEERSSKWHYYIVSSIIDCSFFSQIIIAATLTALAASDQSNTALTVLGSLNTIIAGLQTYLKGQGLPNRIRQYAHNVRKLREHIEDRERDFSVPDCKLNVDRVIADISAMYRAVRQTAEDNQPDTYLQMGGAGKKLLGHKHEGTAGAEQPAEASVDPVAKAEAAIVAENPAAKKPAMEESKSAPADKSGDDPAAGESSDAAAGKRSESAAAEGSGGDAAAGKGEDEGNATAGATEPEASGKSNGAPAAESSDHPNAEDATEETPLLPKSSA